MKETGIASSKAKPAILSIIPNFSDKHVPKVVNLLNPLASPYEENIEFDYLNYLINKNDSKSTRM